jgi:hypothetical protein
VPGVFDALRYLDCMPDIEGATPQDVLVSITPSGNCLSLVENGLTIKTVANATQAVEYLHLHLFYHSLTDLPEAAVLHAACLRHTSRRLLLVGAKGAGKTTLALRLIREGYEIEGDEHVFMKNGGVIARPRACRVKEHSLEYLAEHAEIISTSPWYQDRQNGRIFNVDPRWLGSTWRIEQGDVHYIVFLRANHGGPSSVRPLQPSIVAQLLMTELGLRETQRGSCIGSVAALVTKAQAFELLLGDHSRAVDCIKAITKGSGLSDLSMRAD